jgi:hypothetical protein
VKHVVFSILLAITLGLASAVAQELAPVALQDAVPLPSKPSDPYEALARTLALELASLRSDLLARDIALSNCSATIDSVRLTKRADAMVEEFKRLYGGEWVWKSCQANETVDCNRPVRPAPQREQK